MIVEYIYIYIYIYNENPRGFTLAYLRRKLIRPGDRGKFPKIIVIVG